VGSQQCSPFGEQRREKRGGKIKEPQREDEIKNMPPLKWARKRGPKGLGGTSGDVNFASSAKIAVSKKGRTGGERGRGGVRTDRLGLNWFKKEGSKSYTEVSR